MESIGTLLLKLKIKYEEDLKNSKNSYLSDEIRWLVSFIRKQLVLEIFKRRIGSDDNDIDTLTDDKLKQFKNSDDITKVLLELVFDVVIRELDDIRNKKDIERIIGKEKIGREYGNTDSIKHELDKYIKFFQSSMFRENLLNKSDNIILKFIKDDCKNARETILKNFCMNLNEFNIDLNILKQTLNHSMSVRPVVLTVTVDDIINIHNILVSLKSIDTDESDGRRHYLMQDEELFRITPDFVDPLYQHLNEIGEVDINIDNNSIAESLKIKSLRMNLYLSTQLLDEADCIAK